MVPSNTSSKAVWQKIQTETPPNPLCAIECPQALGRRAHDVGLQHRIHHAMRRRRDAKLKAELHDLAAEPGQFEPVAAIEIERHRRLHGWRRVAGKVENR